MANDKDAFNGTTPQDGDDLQVVSAFWLVDLASLRFQWSADGRSLAVLTDDGEHLAAVAVERPSDQLPAGERAAAQRRAAAVALDAVAAAPGVARVRPDGTLATLPVALYNPHSWQISAAGRVFEASHPVPVEGPGREVLLLDGSAGSALFEADEVTLLALPAKPLAVRRLRQLIAAHTDL